MGSMGYSPGRISYSGDNMIVPCNETNDSISGSGNNVTFFYEVGNGNDTINGFNETSTLRVAGSDCSSVVSGSDVIVTVGENYITLVGAANLSTVNIVSNDQSVAYMTVGNNTPTFYSSIQDAVNAAAENQHGSQIRLLKDTEGTLDLSSIESTNRININIYLNKKTFTATDTIKINKSNAEIRFQGNGTITSTGNVSTLFEVSNDNSRLNLGNVSVDATNLASGGYIANVTGGTLQFNGDNNSNITSNNSVIRNAGGRLEIRRGTINADILLSGSTWSDYWALALNYGTVNGNLLFDSAALNAGVLTKISIEDDGNSTFTENPDITTENFSNLVANQVAGSSDTYSLKLPEDPANDSYVASLIVNGAITYYTSLQEAMTAAAQSTTNGTLTLLKDCAGSLDFSNFVHSGNFISVSYSSNNGGGSQGGSGNYVDSFDGCSVTNGFGRFIVNLNGHTFTATDTINVGSDAWIVIKNGNITTTGGLNTLFANNGGELDLQAVTVDATSLAANGYIAINNDGALAFENNTSVNSNNAVIKSTDGQLRIGNSEDTTIKADILLSSTGATTSEDDWVETPIPFILGGGTIDGDLLLDSAAVNADVLNKIYISSEGLGTFTANPALTNSITELLEVYDNDSDGIYNVRLNSDVIVNSTADSLVTGTNDKDSIYNNGDGVTISALGGDDYINNRTSNNVSINAGDGNNTIETGNDSWGNTIDAGTGNDIIHAFGQGDLIVYRGGNGVIDGYGADDTIKIMNGTVDEVKINGGLVKIKVGNDTLTILDGGYQSAINIVDANGEEIPYEATFATAIQNTTSDTIIAGTDGDDNIYNNAVNVTINAGAGDDSIGNHGGHENGNALIDGGEGDDTIDNHVHIVTIRGGAGNDYITTGDRATIEGGDGDDTIFGDINNGDSITIRGGAGKDSISNFGMNSIIDGGEDDDYIGNGYDYPDYGMYSPDNAMYSTINGGSGNDTIYNGSASSKILGDAGNDYIVNSGDNVIFQYTSGDGNDTIYGFRADSTLQIGGGTGTYSTQVSGADIIVKVGEGSINLRGAATLSTVNIAGEYNTSIITGTEGDDTINNTVAGATIQALEGNNYIHNTGANVLINGGTGNDSVENYGNSLSINGGAGADSIYNVHGSNVSISGGDDNDSIRNGGNNVKIEGGAGDDSITNNNSSSNVTIDAGAGNDKISNSGSNVTIEAGAGNDSINNQGASVTVDGGDGADTINNYGANVTINGGAEADEIVNSGENVTIDAGDGNDYINNSGSNVMINGGEGQEHIINYSSGVTIAAGNDNDSIKNMAVLQSAAARAMIQSPTTAPKPQSAVATGLILLTTTPKTFYSTAAQVTILSAIYTAVITPL